MTAQLTIQRSRRKVENNSAPGRLRFPEALEPASACPWPQNHREILRFRSPTVKPTCRRPAERITMAVGGYSHHGIALRSDKAGEGSGRGRKATGHTRLQHRPVLKAKPGFRHRMARLAHQSRSTLRTMVFTLMLYNGFDLENAVRSFPEGFGVWTVARAGCSQPPTYLDGEWVPERAA